MERIDKILSSTLKISRTEVKKLMKKQCVTINGERVTDPTVKADAITDEIALNSKPILYKKHIYIMLNKPKGVVSASQDRDAPTVVDLVPENLKRTGLFPAGRLDADTTGFVLITDDGDFAHRILSPKNHVEKTYIALLEKEITDSDIEHFKNGVELKDGTLCLESRLERMGDRTVKVVIHEGKYHQVKRMFAALGNKVIELRRIKMGNLELDGNLKEGECREITYSELEKITEKETETD